MTAIISGPVQSHTSGKQKQMVGEIASDQARRELVLQLEARHSLSRKEVRESLPIPTVFDEYMRFVESGKPTYNDDVVAAIATKYGLVQPGQRCDHQAVHDRRDTLLIQLHTEVYLSGKQRRTQELIKERDRLAAEGYLPITELEPEPGMKIRLKDGKTYRLAKGQYDDWVLLPPGKRVNGMSFNSLKSRHRAFEKAATRGTTSVGGEAVCMYQPLSVARRTTSADRSSPDLRLSTGENASMNEGSPPKSDAVGNFLLF